MMEILMYLHFTLAFTNRIHYCRQRSENFEGHEACYLNLCALQLINIIT